MADDDTKAFILFKDSLLMAEEILRRGFESGVERWACMVALKECGGWMMMSG
jgi:hypothetical protein